MDNRLVARLRHSLDEHQLPGLAVVIRQRNEDLFAGGVGCFDVAQQRTVTASTQYGVASLSKFVTAALLMRLHERQLLSIDDLLVRYFPSLRVAQQAPITLAHLMSHSSGLPGLPGRFYARNLDDRHDRSGGVGKRDQVDGGSPLPDLLNIPTIVSPPELVDLMNQLEFDVLAPPGELLNYSNEGFCLLGGVIEQVTQRPYADLVREVVFDPLQMTQSLVGDAVGPLVSGPALPLHRDGADYRMGKFWLAPLFYPAGGCVCSARDVARLIGSLADQTSTNSSILSAESKQRMMAPHMRVASRPSASIGYGLGLEFQQIDAGTTMLWHSGQRAGVSSFMGWLNDQALAVSVLCNVADAPVTAIAHELIGEALGRADVCWPPAGIARQADPGQAIPTDVESFVGRYASLEGIQCSVEQTDHGLVFKSRALSEPLLLRFAGRDYGTVGSQTFRFLPPGLGTQAGSLALDLRVIQRV